jgi:antitoxin component HigA of HigAB toxin-antitoxin module
MQFTTWASKFLFEYGLSKILDKGFSKLSFTKQSAHKTCSPIPDIYGVELLKVLIDENDLRRRDLANIFGTPSKCHAILRGEQQLTFEHLQKLSEYFMISPLAFFPQRKTLCQ